jgi:2-polyprenyl-6-methoxyphenol hydroxylase-like FAD-dependent oxidoreductase
MKMAASALSTPEASPQVPVVGAGPTGQLLAAELERREVPCLLIDASDAPLGWDRATVVHPRSMEIFEALGLADSFLDQGVRVRAARFRSERETLGEMTLESADSRYGFDLGLSEEMTESILTDYLEERGGAVTGSTRLLRLASHPDGVVATVERDEVQDEIVASWVVGCDGFHSSARELLGIEFPGTDVEAPWAVFDATLEGWDEEFDRGRRPPGRSTRDPYPAPRSPLAGLPAADVGIE